MCGVVAAPPLCASLRASSYSKTSTTPQLAQILCHLRNYTEPVFQVRARGRSAHGAKGVRVRKRKKHD